MPGGRPTKYKKRFCTDIIDFFDIEPFREATKTIMTAKGSFIEEAVQLPNKLPTITGFARTIGVSRKTLYNWADDHEEFLHAIEQAQELQEEIWSQNSLLGYYNSNFSKFFGVNVMGWSDKKAHEVGGTGGGPININMNPVKAK